MFKTLQRLPGVITIFNNPRLATSSSLVSHASQLVNSMDSGRNITLDVTEKEPTSEQLKFIQESIHGLQGIKPSELPKPTLVDWFEGKVSVQDEKTSLEIIKRAIDSAGK